MKKPSICNDNLKQDILKRLFEYDALLGRLRWIDKPNRSISAGTIAGTCNKDRSHAIGYQGIIYTASRLIFCWHYGYYPDGEIIHKDGNSNNDYIENLAERKYQSRHKGVTYRFGKYLATASKEGLSIYIGTYDTEQEAAEAFEKAFKAK
jgi:hypothetical protein